MGSAMPMPSRIGRWASTRRALHRCALACAWCAARPPRGQANASVVRMARSIAPPGRVVRSSSRHRAAAGTQLAYSMPERCEAICIIFRIARVPVVRRVPRDAWSESNPVLPSPRREETARLHGGIKAREVAMSFGRPLTPFVQPTPEPPCRRAPKPFLPRRRTSRGKR